MVQLHEDGLGCHLPVHAESLVGRSVLRLDVYAVRVKKPLAFRPDGAGAIHRLEFDSHEVLGLAIAYRNQAIVDTPTRHSQLCNDPQLISGFVEIKQVDAVGENLAAFKKTKRANHRGKLYLPIRHRASPDGQVGLALAVL